MDDIYRSDESDATGGWIQTLIRTEIAKQAAFLATVTFVDGYNVEIARSSSEGVADGQMYASAAGFMLAVGDLVVCQPVGGEPIVMGKVANGEQLAETIDVGMLDVTGDLLVEGAISTTDGLNAASLTGGPALPSVLGTGTPQLGMYLEGNGAWSYPTIMDGPFQRPGLQMAASNTAGAPTAGQAVAHYLGQSIKPVAQMAMRTNIATAYVTGTGGTPWAEVAIATGTPTLAGSADLTIAGWVSVSGIFNATGGLTATVSGLAIPAHSHIWIVWGSQGGTTGGVAYAPVVGIADPATTGLNLFRAATRPSTMAAATTFAGFTGAPNQAWWVVQVS